MFDVLRIAVIAAFLSDLYDRLPVHVLSVEFRRSHLYATDDWFVSLKRDDVGVFASADYLNRVAIRIAEEAA